MVILYTKLYAIYTLLSVKLKIGIILRNKKDKNSWAATNKEISTCKKIFGDLEITK